MYTQIGAAELKTGETMHIGAVDAPDVEWRERLLAFVGHKGPDWLPQIDLALSRPLDNLQTRIYVGLISGELACQSVISGNQSCAILGHVYTAPDHRRKGAIHALLNALMEDGRSKYQVIMLGAEAGSPAYRLYETLGFRPYHPNHGEMFWQAPTSSKRSFFAPDFVASATVRPTRWEDWPSWYLSAMLPIPFADEETFPRSPLLGLDVQQSLELPFIQLQERRARDPRVQAVTAVGSYDYALGWAILAPCESTDDAGEWMLDLFACLGAEAILPNLLNAVQLPDAPVAALIDSNAVGYMKARLLADAGFSTQTPASWTDTRSVTHPVVKMVRE